MRSFVVMAMFLASFAHASWKDYTQVRNLELSADGLSSIEVNAGAGAMDVRGIAGQGEIEVKATIVVPNASEEDAANVIEKKMTLSLERQGDGARLISDFDQGLWGMGSNARIDLEISVPEDLSVSIEDGSGSIDIVAVRGDIYVDDGSGSIDVQDVANLVIEDGSGSIDVTSATGDVLITDGSGSIRVRAVDGSVTIDDGSGGINVDDVARDLKIVDDGSGGVSFSNIRGSIEQES